MEHKVRPLNDRIIVKRAEPKEQTKGGIIIPDNAKEKPVEGEVKAVGPGKLLDNGTRVAPDVKKGDRVLFGKYAGTELASLGKDWVILREEDILGIIEG